MTITLADVHMLTGLKIVGPLQPYNLLSKPEGKIKSIRSGGWGGYIAEHKADKGSTGKYEHVAFLNMWLEKYLFCGSSCSPNANHLFLAERLASGANIPFGKFLLGSLYFLMHQVTKNLIENKPIGTIGGPWWLLQMWLNLYMHKAAVNDLKNLSFPSSNYTEAQEKTLSREDKFRRCQSFGEAALAILINGNVQFFKGFYKGLPTEIITWFAYLEIDEFELPHSFRFE